MECLRQKGRTALDVYTTKHFITNRMSEVQFRSTWRRTKLRKCQIVRTATVIKWSAEVIVSQRQNTYVKEESLS